MRKLVHLKIAVGDGLKVHQKLKQKRDTVLAPREPLLDMKDPLKILVRIVIIAEVDAIKAQMIDQVEKEKEANVKVNVQQKIEKEENTVEAAKDAKEVQKREVFVEEIQVEVKVFTENHEKMIETIFYFER